MKAAVVKMYGVPEVADFEEPKAKDGQQVVEILMAGPNPVDIILPSGHIPAIALPLPGVVGIEGVGTTDGKRVYFGRGVSPFGSVAQRTFVDSVESFPVPEGLRMNRRSPSELPPRLRMLLSPGAPRFSPKNTWSFSARPVLSAGWRWKLRSSLVQAA